MLPYSDSIHIILLKLKLHLDNSYTIQSKPKLQKIQPILQLSGKVIMSSLKRTALQYVNIIINCYSVCNMINLHGYLQLCYMFTS